MATIKEVKREMRYREWAEEIAEYQNSGMKIKEWCRMKGIPVLRKTERPSKSTAVGRGWVSSALQTP